MRDPVGRQVAAYNERDLDGFLDAYARGCRIEDGEGHALLTGKIEMRSAYKVLFDASPHLHCEICRRFEIGEWVFTEENVTGIRVPGGPSSMHALVAYLVRNGRIRLARLFI